MREHCSLRHTLTSCLSCNQLLCLFFTPTRCLLSPTGGASVLISMPYPLTHANSCALALPPLSGLSGVYLICVPRARQGLAHPGHIQSTLCPTHPPSPFSTTLMLSLCLNGRKALWVGNGLHQTLRGARERVTGIQRECERRGEEEQGGGSMCVVGRWGSEKAGGRKLIITIDC